jgi:hypothetical protein
MLLLSDPQGILIAAGRIQYHQYLAAQINTRPVYDYNLVV